MNALLSSPLDLRARLRGNSLPRNSGVAVAVRGSVVDVRFFRHLPPIHSMLLAGEKDVIAIEVLAQRDAHHVRYIAQTPTQKLAHDMTVMDTGGPLEVPVGNAIRSRMFDVFGSALDHDPALTSALYMIGAIDEAKDKAKTQS